MELANILDVAPYNISTRINSKLHATKFCNGREAIVVFGASGESLGLRAINVCLSIASKNEWSLFIDSPNSR